MTTVEILQEEFESIKADLILKHNQLGMKASGLWESELTVEIEENDGRTTARIYGLSYTEQLVFGRKPGKFPPIKAIEQWILDKGIRLERNIKISSLAFLIARKISQEGTKYFRQGGTELIRSVVTPERIQSIISKVKEIDVVTMTNGLINKIRETA